EGKVRDLLPAERDRESHPVVERGVDHFVSRQPALRVRDRHVTYLATPALDEGHRERVGSTASDLAARRPFRQRDQLFLDEGCRPLDLEPANVGACEDIAGVPGRDGNLREAVDAGRELVTNIPVDPTGASDEAYQSELLAALGGKRPRVFEPRLNGRLVPQET